MNETQRAVVEYKEVSTVDEKAVKFKCALQGKDAAEIRRLFWGNPLWNTATTQGVTILSITWPDEEKK